ncbi:MFS transporter [Enterobacteriaceae bacterium 4M9]|nr:MFS transporter [Enterobacteriaceae bacterium 4M9]
MLKIKNTSTAALLVASLLLTVGRGMTLPFMTIYLTRQFAMDVHQVGIAMSGALTTGVLFSLFFGMLADKFDKRRYMLAALALFFSGFIAIPLLNHPLAVVAFFSVINCAYSVFSTVLKSYFADTLPVYEKPRIFSLNYTFINIGWTLGPPLGTWFLMYSLNLPFWLAALSAVPPLWLVGRYVQPLAPVRQNAHIAWSPASLLRDNALRWFTLSTFLGQLVFGAFVTCLSQYALAIGDAQLAQQIVAVVLPVNAVVVVLLQYQVGKRVRPDNLRRLMLYGSLFFATGLLGFMVAGSNLWLWGLAAAVFTLGELIYAPGEYMLLDHIAPPGLKASYFSAQTLGTLGGALNPLLTGYVLTWLPPWTLFASLIVVTGCAYGTMLMGMRCGPFATARTAEEH